MDQIARDDGANALLEARTLRPAWYPPRMTTRSSTPFRALLAGAAALALMLSACGSGTSSTGASAGAAHASDFVLNEWAITAPTTQLHAGKVQVTVANIGSETHELVIIKASDAASLPTKADGSVDEEAIAGADKPGEIPDVAAGKSVTKTVDLPAGTYVAMCNLVERSTGGDSMSGSAGTGSHHMGGGPAMMDHVHFRLGMRTTFTVV